MIDKPAACNVWSEGRCGECAQ